MKTLRALALLLLVCGGAFAQNAARLPQPRAQFFDANGYPLAGGLIYTCAAGAACPGTPQTTYTTAAGNVANQNPIVLDASGSADIWFSPSLSYKVVVETSAGVVLSTTDNLGDAGASVGNALAANLASSASGKGAALVAYLPSAPGGVARTVQKKLDDLVSVKDFGAAADGVTNDTTAFQAALNSGASVIDGGGKTYLVSGNLLVSSNTTLQNFSLKLVGGSAVPLSGLMIDGTTVAKSGVTIRNVSIDGSRTAMSGFGTNTGDDGDKSCFRIIGSVSNLLLDHVTGNFCGTDGLQIWSYSLPATGNDSDLRFHNITVRSSTFKYNRRQGISLDSAVNVVLSGIVAEYNGLDLATIQTTYTSTPNASDLTDWQPSTNYTPAGTCDASFTASIAHGDCGGLTTGGNRYANGIDIEGYGVGSGLHSIEVANGTFLHNATGGLLVLDNTATSATGFVARSDLRIIGNTADDGYYPNSSIPWDYAINVNGPLGEYSGVTIAGNTTTGLISVFGAGDSVVAGNRINAPNTSYAVYTGSSPNLEVLANATAGKSIQFYDQLGSVNPEFFPRVAATTNPATSTNYAALFGSLSNPVGVGNFSTANVFQSFGLPLALNPAGNSILFGTMTNQFGFVQIAGSLTLQQDTSAALNMGRYSAGNPYALFNAQDNDGSAVSGYGFEFGAAAAVFKILPGTLQHTGLKSNSGTRYVCVDTSGNFVSSASACSGT